jgi:CelD/BcsL family acetyltransferase involved in cellulose biosynthesis
MQFRTGGVVFPGRDPSVIISPARDFCRSEAGTFGLLSHLQGERDGIGVAGAAAAPLSEVSVSSVAMSRFPAAQSETLDVRVVTDPAEWGRLEPSWRALWVASGAAASMRWEWMRTWWQIYGETYGGDGLRLVIFERKGQVVGIMPLYIGRNHKSPASPRELRFLSTGEARFEETCAAYLTLLALPADADRCAARFAAALDDGRLGSCDRVQFFCVDPGSPLLRAWQNRAVWTPEQQAPCYVANLEGGFDQYLGRLSANTRQQARRILRSAEQGGTTFEIASTAEQVESFYGELVELHQARWHQLGQAGCFAAERFKAFHRSLSQQLLEAGDIVLARLSRAGKPIAVIHGYISGPRFEYYLAGTALDEGDLKSPGIAAHLRLKMALIERGITEYDYLHGFARYKIQYATGSRDIFQMGFERTTARGVAHSLWRAGRGAAQEVRRVAYRAIGASVD